MKLKRFTKLGIDDFYLIGRHGAEQLPKNMLEISKTPQGHHHFQHD